jgi:predicted secreted hydrolase
VKSAATTGLILLILIGAGLFVLRGQQRGPAPPSGGLDVGLLMAGAGDGFAPAEADWTYRFPRDHGAHPQFRSELWSVKGHMEDARGRYFGVQLVVLRVAVQPRAPQRESAWAASQVYAAQLALTDPAGAGFAAEERLSRAALGLAGSRATPVRVWVEDWALTAAPDGGLRLEAAAGTAALTLELAPVKPSLGDDALDVAGLGPSAGGGFHFYLMPRLALSGVLELAGEAHQVTGLGWLDRAWGEVPVTRGQVALDRFSVQLDDGRDLLCLQLRRRDGTGTPVPSCLLVGPDGAVASFRRREIRLEPEAFWTSPVDGTDYPVAWRLEVMPVGLDLRLRPRVEDQEIETALRAWRGAVGIEGAAGGEPVTGRGFIELVGYGEPGPQGGDDP